MFPVCVFPKFSTICKEMREEYRRFFRFLMVLEAMERLVLSIISVCKGDCQKLQECEKSGFVRNEECVLG